MIYLDNAATTWPKPAPDIQVPNPDELALEKKLNENLNYRPTWAADHWRTDGKKTWVDIATEEVFKDEKK